MSDLQLGEQVTVVGYHNDLMLAKRPFNDDLIFLREVKLSQEALAEEKNDG